MNRNSLNLVGESFEMYLALRLKQYFPQSVVLHNVWSNATFLDTRTQIDLIYVSDKIFMLVEAKNWRKSITGNYNDSFWIMGGGNVKKPEKYSPLRQNMMHIRSLRNCMRVRGVEPAPAYNYVVVPNGTDIRSNCVEVIHESDLWDVIRKLERTSTYKIDKNEYRDVIQQVSDYYRR